MPQDRETTLHLELKQHNMLTNVVGALISV